MPMHMAVGCVHAGNNPSPHSKATVFWEQSSLVPMAARGMWGAAQHCRVWVGKRPGMGLCCCTGVSREEPHRPRGWTPRPWAQVGAACLVSQCKSPTCVVAPAGIAHPLLKATEPAGFMACGEWVSDFLPP